MDASTSKILNEEDSYLQIAGIQHFIFCRRQWALIHIEQAWKDNFFTIDGSIKHENVDFGRNDEKIKGKRILRSLPVISHKLRIRGICDVVELVEDATGDYFSKYDKRYKVVPVEYKRGKSKDDLSDVLQLIAQVVCLEEMMGVVIERAVLYYHETHRRDWVTITSELKSTLKDIIQEMSSYYDRKYTPKVKTKTRCRSCSLRDICLPELRKVKSAEVYIQRRLNE
ncbi:CRISPR-associated protein Cas4 [uncultured Veillonella sp.]|uniref:CRISPR-associated protein Cas4 n=1 Tax=uncultured Veillonella sp. TaxID=159268 RepID=UPI0026258086|nr:CRISPR-associated protein Cas4 [uncultured Veillonella sp.]